MPNQNSVNEFKKFKQRLKKLNINGIETIVGDYCPFDIFYNLPIKGLHIIYFPTWINQMSSEELIECFKTQFEIAKKLNVYYMVFHVSHVSGEEVFTFQYKYTDQEVLEKTLELVNIVFQGEGPYLLFENLPWPGLNFKDYHLTKNFFERVQYKKKGFILDLSHMICLNSNLKNFEQASEYILNQIQNLNELKNYIFGVHINGSISYEYLNQDFSFLLQTWKNSTFEEKYYIETNHIQLIDTHSIFASNKLKNILDSLPLKFKIFELKSSSLEDLLDKVEIQLNYINF
jgi:hypothetical protein